MAKAEVAQQIDAIWDMSKEDIYKQLGVASLGTESTIEAANSLKFLKSTAANDDGAVSVQNLEDMLLDHGKKYFDKLWNGVKGIVCTIYHQGKPIGDAKDLAAYIVGLLVTAGKIVNPLAAMVIVVAVKIGLDMMCPV